MYSFYLIFKKLYNSNQIFDIKTVFKLLTIKLSYYDIVL